MIRHIVILGAGGDLTARYLLPALARLVQARRLDEDVRVSCISRQRWDDGRFREHARGALARHAPGVPPEARDALLERASYHSADAGEAGDLGRALGRLDAPILAYLALPPQVFRAAVDALRQLELPTESRLIVEKPFGVDLDSARQLNAAIHRAFPERCVFRMDHSEQHVGPPQRPRHLAHRDHTHRHRESAPTRGIDGAHGVGKGQGIVSACTLASLRGGSSRHADRAAPFPHPRSREGSLHAGTVALRGTGALRPATNR